MDHFEKYLSVFQSRIVAINHLFYDHKRFKMKEKAREESICDKKVNELTDAWYRTQYLTLSIVRSIQLDRQEPNQVQENASANFLLQLTAF